MIEKLKSVLLLLLVSLSLVQSYLLAYSTPYKDAKVKTDQDYVKTEPLGSVEQIENLIFPEQLVIHMGEDKHTVFYPSNDPYYDLILRKLKVRQFNGLQRDTVGTVDWDQVRREDEGVELRFARAVPFELLRRVFEIDSDFLFSGDSIDRIWIYSTKGREEVRTFFFSPDGRNVYESTRADMTVADVSGFVGFGEYWDPYSSDDGIVYAPDQPITRMLEMQVAFSRYTTEQMQDNLFPDPGTTHIIQDKQNGPQFYTDYKRGLKVEPESGWLTYTDLVAPTNNENDFIDNVFAAVSFVNQHGGWNGMHELVQEVEAPGVNTIRFQQYYKEVPVVSNEAFHFGYMQLVLQQGDVSSYERSLLVLSEDVTNKSAKQLPGGQELRSLMSKAESPGNRIVALFPAYRPALSKESLYLRPAWAVRMENGEVAVLANSGVIK